MRRVFTWHVHGSYLFYLSQCDCIFYIPVSDNRAEEGYHGRGDTFPFGGNVIEVEISDVARLEFDCILFQSEKNYLYDQYKILTDAQRQLPKIYLEHNTPTQYACNTRHVVDDPSMVLVHVTHYNQLMWDNNRTPHLVIKHGIVPPSVSYSGHIAKGLVVLNNIALRGRTAGYDIFLEARKHVLLDVVGMGTEEIGLGEILHPQLPLFMSQYRFYFHPARHTSLGLSLLEAMMVGMPVAGIATTELPMVIKDGISGFYDTNLEVLVGKMRRLLEDNSLAQKMGANAQATALEQYNINRFVKDWELLFDKAMMGTIPISANVQ